MLRNERGTERDSFKKELSQHCVLVSLYTYFYAANGILESDRGLHDKLQITCLPVFSLLLCHYTYL